MDFIKVLVFAILCIVLFLFFQTTFLAKKGSGCSKESMPICDGALDCVGGSTWRCSTRVPQKCDPNNAPACTGARCISGNWICPQDYMGNCNMADIPQNCKYSICANGRWKCMDYTRPCNNRMKPVCDDDEEAVCNMNGTWSCEKGGCSIENKPDCPHPVCSQGRWICYDKFPGASLSMLMDLTPTSGMGGMNLVVQSCDPLVADDCDPSYFLPISIDSSSYSQNLYSGFQMRGTVPFTTESNITTFLWNIQENPTPILQMDLDFESVIMNGAGTNRCAINLVLIDPSTSVIIASCNITKNSSNTFSQIINSNTPLVTTDEPFPKYATDWVFYFDSTLKVATIGFALQFSTTYDDMEHSAFYNILPLGMNGPRSFIISSTTKN